MSRQYLENKPTVAATLSPPGLPTAASGGRPSSYPMSPPRERQHDPSTRCGELLVVKDRAEIAHVEPADVRLPKMLGVAQRRATKLLGRFPARNVGVKRPILVMLMHAID
jgi:hypothetical protein